MTMDVDVITVGAGMGGLYAVHRMRQEGLSIIGFEGGGGVGGVWYHNRYPGARVDVESYYYAFFFSDDLVRDWQWTERYPAQPEILRYLDHVADRFDLRRHFRFDTWVTSAQWDDAAARYRVTTSQGDTFTCRFLLMTTGQLSKARKPAFPGLDDFRGEWVLTAHWPERPVPVAGRRVAVIGTGSSGVQVIPELAREATHLYVMQRTPNYPVPSQNGPLDRGVDAAIRADPSGTWQALLRSRAGFTISRNIPRAADLTPEQRSAELEKCWAEGAHYMNMVFAEQGSQQEVNDIVADFVRSKIRAVVKDPEVAARLTAMPYPIGTRRLAVENGYCATFNRDNVTLVDVREDPIECITANGIRTRSGRHVDVDLIVFALGFEAFTGSLDAAGIRNAEGAGLTDSWNRGPRTLLGLMAQGFPNLFLPTGPGGPSVLVNLIVHNVHNLDWIAECIRHMQAHGHTKVMPRPEAIDQWQAEVQRVSPPLRRSVDNYMVHVNKDDGTRVFIPYAAGLDAFDRIASAEAAAGYPGFTFE
jgi:cation diffusion facilitator CzcD-associated flavoprotein CzcO